MPVEKKFDYGIAAGLGAEWSIRRIRTYYFRGHAITMDWQYIRQ